MNDNRSVDFKKLSQIKNYHDLSVLLNQLKRKEVSLAENASDARNEAVRLQQMAIATNRGHDLVEGAVLELCSAIYLEFANAMQNKVWDHYWNKINELVTLCDSKNNPSPAQTMLSSGSTNRAKPKNSDVNSARHSVVSPKVKTKDMRPASPFGSGSDLDVALLGSPSSNSPKRPATPANSPSGHLIKSDFLRRTFSSLDKEDMQLALTNYQESEGSIKNASAWLALIESDYNELKSQCCSCGLFDRFRSNFFDGAFKFVQEKLGVTISKETLTANQKLWIVLKYANDKQDTRTKRAVDSVASQFSGAALQNR